MHAASSPAIRNTNNYPAQASTELERQIINSPNATAMTEFSVQVLWRSLGVSHGIQDLPCANKNTGPIRR
ncbi:hypothetical protein GX48_01307 [Paracoccidioides brasiliensis]|nr:hypothetical protein GX48_01307 [Paracoccidioides brasiliensis]